MSNVRTPQVGDHLGQYQLVELLAVGGMGLVFRAFEPALGRYVAVKVLSPELAADVQFARQFIAEARTLATLNHPNVVHVYSVGEEHGLPYFAMEFVEGDNLDALIQAVKHLNVTEAAQIIRQAVLGLQHAHERGVIHDDIKPANLVVTHQGILKVTDFGLARRAHVTKSSEYGTPEYASPEAIEGQPADHRSDIYSLGATFYHILAGRAPFIGETPDAIMQQHLHKTAPPISQFNLKVPPSLNRLVGKCLAKKPGARYQSYAEFLIDLDKIIADLNSARPPRRTADSSRYSLPIAVIVVLLLAVGVYYWMSRPDPIAQPPPPIPPPGPTLATNLPPDLPPPDLPPPPIPEDNEPAAEKIAGEMNSQAEPLILAGKLRAAWLIYQQWPQEPSHSTTRAHAFIMEQRQRIATLARESWNSRQAQMATLRSKHQYEDALAVCDTAAQAIGSTFPELDSLLQGERKLTRQERDAYRQQVAAQRDGAEKALAARRAELQTQTSKLVLALQWDKAAQELRAAAAQADGALATTIQEMLQNEVTPLVALRQAILARVKAKPPGPSLTLLTRTGSLEGQVLVTDDGRLALGHVLTHGVVSTPIPWEELTPASVLRFYAAGHDASNPEERFAEAILVLHFAVAGQARLEDARAKLQTVAPLATNRTAFITGLLTRIEEIEKRVAAEAAQRAVLLAREQKAALYWSQVEAARAAKDTEAARCLLDDFLENNKDSDCARTHQAEIEQLQRTIAALPAPAPFVPVVLDFDTGMRKIVSTADQTVEKTFDGARSFATSGFLRKLNVPGYGLPDHGRVIAPIGQQRIPFWIQLDRDADALVLLDEGRVVGANQTLWLGRHRKRQRQVALLFAVAGGNTRLTVIPRYEEDNADPPAATTVRLSNWLDLPPADTKAAGTVLATATDRRRIALGVQVIELDPNQVLRSLRLEINDAEARWRGMSVAILAISLRPAK